MNETELRLQAALTEQRNLLNAFTDRCLNLAADVAVLQNTITELQTKPSDPPPEKQND